MKRLVAAVAMSCLLLGSLAPTAIGAPPTHKFAKPAIDKIDPTFRPFLAGAAKPVTVVLQLADAPAVTVAGLSSAQRETRAKDLRTKQGSLDAGIAAAGGRVLDRFQYAYNGIKVSTTSNRLETLAALPGVVAVKRLQTYTPDNIGAVKYIGAPTAWQTDGKTGAGQTIAIIDTGIDYIHTNFGGPGTPEAYAANDPTIIEPGTFPTAKVIDGYDFVGDSYNADPKSAAYQPVPHPDPDPMDCYGHGSHVAGTAAGQGVLADHSTYTGPYDPSLYADPTEFVIGPGVAPEAKLISLRVFGCAGSTDVVVDALEWVAAYNVTHANGIGVVNMSLGSTFGANDDPDAVATNNLVSTGVVVVASAGNSNAVPFITGSPAAATQAISVAALDAYPTLPMATVDLPADPAIPAINQNAFPALPVAGTLHVLDNGAGGVKLGCDAADYTDGLSAGKIVAVKRGVCTFVAKGELAFAAGAIGIIVINRDDTAPGALPTFIGYNPELFAIPMIGTDKVAQASLLANEGAAITLSSAGIQANPTYQQVASFSSSGPRYGDNAIKPDVAAPGVNLFSTLSGSGWNGTTFSGTSMASPMTAGTAALVRQAHPSWSPLKVKAAIVNTADPTSASIVDYDPMRAGSGVVQANLAVETKGLATTSDKTASLSYGYDQMNGAWHEDKTITLWNTGSEDITYKLAASSPVVSVWPSTVKVRAHHSVQVRVRASLTASQVRALPTADTFLTGAFGELLSLSGVVVATPQGSHAGYFSLRVPFLMVPRGLSKVDASLAQPLSSSGSLVQGTMNVVNPGIHSGNADVYALGVTDPKGDGGHGTDIRAVGVQTFPVEYMTGAADPNDRGIQFAINSWDRFTTETPNEVDIAIDTTHDGVADYYVFGYDFGQLTAGTMNGWFVSFTYDAAGNYIDYWYADAPMNGSTLVLQALASEIGLAPGSGSFTYWAVGYDGFTGGADATGSASFDAFNPAQSTGNFVAVASRAHASIPVWAKRSAVWSGRVKGWLVVSLDNANGASQADIVLARVYREDHGR